MQELFKQSYELEKKYFLHCAWKSYSAPDGWSLRFLLLMNKYQGVYKFMYDQAQAGVANYTRTKYDVEKCFIEHNWGDATNMEQKIYLLQQLKTNKWWSQLLQNTHLSF